MVATRRDPSRAKVDSMRYEADPAKLSYWTKVCCLERMSVVFLDDVPCDEVSISNRLVGLTVEQNVNERNM